MTIYLFENYSNLEYKRPTPRNCNFYHINYRLSRIFIYGEVNAINLYGVFYKESNIF